MTNTSYSQNGPSIPCNQKNKIDLFWCNRVSIYSLACLLGSLAQSTKRESMQGGLPGVHQGWLSRPQIPVPHVYPGLALIPHNNTVVTYCLQVIIAVSADVPAPTAPGHTQTQCWLQRQTRFPKVFSTHRDFVDQTCFKVADKIPWNFEALGNSSYA